MSIQSSGWQTDALVTIPESLLLSYAWYCFASAHEVFYTHLLTGGIILSGFVALLMCAGAWLAWKKEIRENEAVNEAQRMRTLDMEENILNEAVKDHELDQLKWNEMIRENIGTTPLKHRPILPILLRTFVFAFLACCSLPLLHASGWMQYDLQLHTAAAALLAIVGAWKFGITGRKTWSGALRMLANGAVLYVVVKVLFAITG